MKCRMLIDMPCNPALDGCVVEGGRAVAPAGLEIEHPQAWMLVRGGFAEPADDECQQVSDRVPNSQRGIARAVHERIMREQREFIEQQQLEEDEDE